MFYRFEQFKLAVNHTMTKKIYVFETDFRRFRMKTSNVFYSIIKIYQKNHELFITNNNDHDLQNLKRI